MHEITTSEEKKLATRSFASDLIIPNVRLSQNEEVMKKILLATAVLMLHGCATNSGGYKSTGDVERQLLSMTAEQILIDLGRAHQTTEVSSTKSAWRYADHPGGLTGGNCSIVIVIESGKVVEAKINADDRSWLSFPLGSCRNILANLSKQK